MNTNNLYTALTIGPILKTLQSVKSTKAIWAASYLFSYLIKGILKEIKKIKRIEIILPYSDKVTINGNELEPLDDKFRKRAGFFPDKIIIKGKVELQEIIDNVLKGFAIESQIPEAYLKNYINLYHLSIELNENENVILKINELLDSLELQKKVLENIPKDDPLVSFLEQKSPYNFLIRDEFTKKPFQSTIEISTAEFEEKYKDDRRYVEAIKKLKAGDDENQKEFIKDIKTIVSDNYRNYQKYIAVVQADGDNVGTLLKFLYEQSNKEELIKRFSKNLLSFAIGAVEIIKAYKGTPIYAGGDDLLFFAPVAHTLYNVDNKTMSIKETILTLIKQLDDKFDELFKMDSVFGKLMNNQKAIKIFEEKGDKFKPPTMSYGVSISYYKFPLNQALAEGVNQLFYTAKKTDKKNAVSYTILKHSGQSFGATFHKNETSYTTFNELIKQIVTRDNFIHSVLYKLEPQKEVIKEIGKINAIDRDKIFNNFFLNNFNESVHREKNDSNKLIPFLEKTKQLFIDTYKEKEINASRLGIDKQNEINVNKIYSALRFIDFINNKEERND
ncbi:MAG: type III-B CRISPR-associated protein Cas10/Cmr2 [Ignavibacteria bacterium]|jgi:CRISPR-associated protein Cmr2|nr:type III-B CRISPR-associated protein Cas10/Cmr2 [Ignavibacteria bacterium]